MRILVTGGAGFIGSHLCARLLSEGNQVICVDNLVTGQRENVQSLEADPGFRLVLQDVTALDGDLFPEDVQAVFHLASPASPIGYLRHPLETALANSAGTHRALEFARSRRAVFVVASTSEVYGDPLVHPQNESYWGNVNPNGIRSCYDEGKRFAEALTMIYLREYDLDARIVRIFNTYGPHSDPDDGRIVPNFVTQALLGRPITVYGDGQQTRSLCYVSDLVDGLMKATFTPGTKGEVYNLGNPEEHTVLEFAQVIKGLCASASEIVFREHISADDPHQRCPDIDKARRFLGWEPKVDLEAGLGRTIDWMRGKLSLVGR